MREFDDTLTPDQVYRFAVDSCQPHVDSHPAGKITATTLATVSFAAASRDPSFSETGRRHDISPIPCHDPFNSRIVEVERKLPAASRTGPLTSRPRAIWIRPRFRRQPVDNPVDSARPLWFLISKVK